MQICILFALHCILFALKFNIGVCWTQKNISLTRHILILEVIKFIKMLWDIHLFHLFDIAIECIEVSKNVQRDFKLFSDLIHFKHFYPLKWGKSYIVSLLKVIYDTCSTETVGAYSNLQWDQQRIALDSQTNFLLGILTDGV